MCNIGVTYQLGPLALWFGAAGSVIAACTALFLARRNNAERLSITTGIAHSKLYLVIYNSGSKPVFLHDAGFQLGRFRHAQDDSIESILAGRGLPKVLKPGEEFVSDYALLKDHTLLFVGSRHQA